MRLIDADALREDLRRFFPVEVLEGIEPKTLFAQIMHDIDNAPTVETYTEEDIRLSNKTGFDDGYEKAKEDFERPQDEWIPVSERLPDERDWYLGLFKEPDTGFIGLPYICDYVGEITKGTTKEGWILRHCTDVDNPSDYFRNLICVAWQPLPEPYKEGGTENGGRVIFMPEKTYIIKIPNWCKIDRFVEIKDIYCERGDDKNHWYKERIISFGYDGFFHKAYNCPVYYTKFEEFGKTVRLMEDTNDRTETDTHH